MSHSNNNNVESISNNSSEATLPPSYRTRNRQTDSYSHVLRPISAYNNDPNHDFTLAVRSSSMENLSARQLSPNSSNRQTTPKNVNNSKCTSINRSSSSSNQNQIDREESISETVVANSKSSKKLLNNNGNNNDLVTIVTISGFIDENENKGNIHETSSAGRAMTTEELSSDISVLAHL